MRNKIKKGLVILAVCISVILFWCEFLVYPFHLYVCSKGFEGIKKNTNDELNVIMISDTHILGKFKGHWFDRIRREWQMSSSFTQAVKWLQPEAVFFLGDLMDEGQWTDENLFNEYADRFFKVFNNQTAGPTMYFIPGNHDLGFHFEIHPERIKWFKKRFDVDSVNILNIKGFPFVTINSMAMHGDKCRLCAGALNLMETYSKIFDCAANESCTSYPESELNRPFIKPIVLQHFPLFRTNENVCMRDEDFDELAPDRDEHYREKWECLSKESTQYILEKIQPRAVFDGHAHRGCKRKWTSPTEFYEYTQNSFNWRNNDVPTILMVSIDKDRVDVKTCYLPRESFIFVGYFFIILFILIFFQYVLMLCLKIKSHSTDLRLLSTKHE